MTEGTALKRLSKVAREFNIATTTIVEFLGKKGISVENNPNTKISEDAYQLLFKEFQQEKKLKEATLGKGLEHVERKTISLEQPKGTHEAEKEGPGKEGGAQEKELLIKDSKPTATSPAAREEVQLPGPKVVGKVEEKKEKEEAPKEAEAVKEEPKAPKEVAPVEPKAPDAEVVAETPAEEEKKENG